MLALAKIDPLGGMTCCAAAPTVMVAYGGTVKVCSGEVALTTFVVDKEVATEIVEGLVFVSVNFEIIDCVPGGEVYRLDAETERSVPVLAEIGELAIMKFLMLLR